MANLRPFQIVMLAIFAVLAVIALFLLSGFSPSGEKERAKYGEVEIWGTFDDSTFTQIIDDIENDDKGFELVVYREVSAGSFHDTFINAVAEGRSPDLVILPGTELVRERSKLIPISYETISARNFRDTYVDGAELFARPDGIFAVPLFVDPVVLYWNRDMFAAAGLGQAPTTWEYIVNSVIGKVTKRDNQRNILQSAIAFGEVNNVEQAKEMLLTLMMQSGSQLIYEEDGRYNVSLNKSVDTTSLPPLEATLQFFTSFSNSNNTLYSWNRSKQNDANAFLSEDLAMYFGYGSEANGILAKNPNLNFDMAPMPQGASATVRRTYGEFYGLAIPRAAGNSNGAFAVASVLASPQYATLLAESYDMTPVTRTAIASGTNDPFREILYGSALVARGWLDPNASASKTIFENMVGDITSGRENVSAAASEAEQKIRLAF